MRSVSQKLIACGSRFWDRAEKEEKKRRKEPMVP